MNIGGYVYSYCAKMPDADYVYGTVHLFNPTSCWWYRLLGSWCSRKKHVVMTFDRNPYSQPLHNMANDSSITFSNYQWNDVLPFTIYRKPVESENLEYYNIIHDATIQQKWKKMMQNYHDREKIDWTLDVSEYNCVYSDILNAEKTHFGLIKLKHRESFLVVYNSRELTESQVGTILKRIFLGPPPSAFP